MASCDHCRVHEKGIREDNYHQNIKTYPCNETSMKEATHVTKFSVLGKPIGQNPVHTRDPNIIMFY